HGVYPGWAGDPLLGPDGRNTAVSSSDRGGFRVHPRLPVARPSPPMGGGLDAPSDARPRHDRPPHGCPAGPTGPRGPRAPPRAAGAVRAALAGRVPAVPGDSGGRLELLRRVVRPRGVPRR